MAKAEWDMSSVQVGLPSFIDLTDHLRGPIRFQLVPQPEHHPPSPTPDLNTPGPGNRGGPGGSQPNGFSGFWDMFSRNRPSGPLSGGSGGGGSGSGNGTPGNPSQRPDSNASDGPPGGWDHHLD